MKKVLLAGLTTLLMFTSGCTAVGNFVKDNERTARITTTYATLKVIKQDEARAQHVLMITEEVLRYAHDATFLTVDGLVGFLRSQIHWDNLDDADTLLMNELLHELDTQLTEHFQGNTIPPEMVITLDTVGGWVTDAARMYL